MKKPVRILCVLVISVSFVLAREVAQARSRDPQRSTKRIERADDLEKLFFGKINAGIEFFSSSNAPFGATTQGLRLFRKTPREPYIIEVKRIPNQEEVDMDLNKKMQDKLKAADQTLGKSKEGRDRFSVILKESPDEVKRKQLQRYKVETKSVAISDSLAQKLQNDVLPVIDNYTYQGATKGCFGYPPMVVFRCYAGTEAHSLTAESPQGEVRRMAEIFLIIIKHIFGGEFDESDCMKTLESYEVAKPRVPEPGIRKPGTLDSLLMLKDKTALRPN